MLLINLAYSLDLEDQAICWGEVKQIMVSKEIDSVQIEIMIDLGCKTGLSAIVLILPQPSHSTIVHVRKYCLNVDWSLFSSIY